MLSVRSLAIYLPAASDGSRRLRGHDEDAFTMVATALERLAPGGWPPAAPVRLRLLGAARSIPPELLQGVLGRPVEIDRSEGAIADAADPVWVVGATIREPSGEPGVSVPGEGAFALVLDAPAPGEEVWQPPFLAQGDGPDLATVWKALRSGPAAPSERAVGDLGEDPAQGRAPPAHPPEDGVPPTRVSEGAYLPPATYQDGIASRWRFMADRCGSCRSITFPTRGRCRACGRADGLERLALPRENLKVDAVTWIGPGGQPTEFDDQVAVTGSYGVALVELAEGVRATVALTDTDIGTVQLGARVDTRLRRLYPIDSSWRYGRKAVAAVRPA